MPQIQDITCQQQQGKQWCWAATALCVMNHYRKYNNRFPLTQQALADEFTEGRDKPYDVYDVLSKYKISNGTKIRALNVSSIIASINNNQPMIMQVGPKGDMHFIVLIGYEKIGDLDPSYIILDPADLSPAPKSVNKQGLGTIQGVQYTKAPPRPSGPSGRCPCPCMIL